MLTINWNGKRYRLDYFASKRKNWKIVAIFLLLIIFYQYFRYDSRHIDPEIPREYWPFRISQHYQQRFLPEYSPAKAFKNPSLNHSGANGEPVYIPPENYEIMQKLYDEEHFNVLASDMMPYQRSLPDMRYPECKEIQYPHRLPTTSVIIVFHNELKSALLRTVWSVINRSPRELIEEIILVDDFSTKDELKMELERYVATLPAKVHLIRTTKREGLIRARLLGAHHAEGLVLTFLDAHIECTDGWLEPILNRIYNDRSVIAVPHIDTISIVDMSYIKNDEKIYGFDWDLIFFGYDIPLRENQRRNYSRTAPLRTPTMIGCAFSIDRRFFYEIGAYDEGMHIWGSENMELSIRAWLCGGSLEIIPCARVAHLFRISSYSFEGDEEVIKAMNNIRFAEVWMDEFKQYYYAKNREAKYTQFGDLEDRFALRKELHCKSFQWFLENIYPESELLVGLNQIGKIMNEESGACLDVLSKDVGSQLKPYECQELNGDQSFAYMRDKRLHSNTEECVGIQKNSDPHKKTAIILDKCSTHDQTQKWEFDQSSDLVINVHTGLCMTSSKSGFYLDRCNQTDIAQHWVIVPL